MSNKKVIFLTIFIILGMIILPTIYKIYNTNNTDKIKVVEEEFLYQALKCYNNDICSKEIVYLKDLYNNNYIKDKLTNPFNKKYYKDESYVNIKTKKVILIS